MKLMKQKRKTKNSLKILIKFIKPYKKEAILAITLTAFEALLEIFIPFLMNYLLTYGVYFNETTQNYEINTFNLTMISLLMIGCAIVAFFIGMLSSKYVSIAGRGFGAELRNETYHKIQDFSFKNIDEFRQSSLITRLTDDNQLIQNAFCNSFRPICRAPIQLIFSIVFSIIISPMLSIILLISMIFIACMYLIILKKAKKQYFIMQDNADLLNQDTKEAIKNVGTVKTYVKENYELTKFDLINNDLRKASVKSYTLTSLNMPIMNLVVFSTVIGILYVGGIFVINKQYGLTTVNIAAFLTYLTQALACFRMLNNSFTQINRAQASIDRTVEILSSTIDLVFDNTSKLKITDGDIKFKNVSFKYSLSAKKPVLQNITLHIKKGEFIGLVGQTGSGKTTIINLIERFYDATEGQILIDNNDIKNYSEEELHNNISISFQSSLLFKGKLIDNLKFGNKNASMDLVEEACKIACCYDFIHNELKDGYNTEISEGGTNLSGGQRERVCIARALITNPKILILDDSFSALDHLTENKLKQNIDKYLKKTTKIVISQKISAIKNADKIIVLDNGTISHIGKHEDLFLIDPIYKDMCISQHEEEEE